MIINYQWCLLTTINKILVINPKPLSCKKILTKSKSNDFLLKTVFVSYYTILCWLTIMKANIVTVDAFKILTVNKNLLGKRTNEKNKGFFFFFLFNNNVLFKNDPTMILQSPFVNKVNIKFNWLLLLTINWCSKICTTCVWCKSVHLGFLFLYRNFFR